MRFDKTEYDGMVVITHQRPKGLWVAQTQLRKSPLKRVAGRYRNSTADSLLTLALISGLQAISSRQVEQHETKPRILIQCPDRAFVETLKANSGKSELFISEIMWEKLTRQIARFELTFESIEQGEQIDLLGDLVRWCVSNVLVDSDRMMPSVPCVVSVLGRTAERPGFDNA